MPPGGVMEPAVGAVCSARRIFTAPLTDLVFRTEPLERSMCSAYPHCMPTVKCKASASSLLLLPCAHTISIRRQGSFSRPTSPCLRSFHGRLINPPPTWPPPAGFANRPFEKSTSAIKRNTMRRFGNFCRATVSFHKRTSNRTEAKLCF